MLIRFFTNSIIMLLKGQLIIGNGAEISVLMHNFTEQLFLLPQTILDELWPRKGSSVSGWCPHMASSSQDTALACICGFHSEVCSQTVISGIRNSRNHWFLSSCSDIPPEDPKATTIQFWSSASSLAHRHSSWFSKSFDDIMYCRWLDLQGHCNFKSRSTGL